MYKVGNGITNGKRLTTCASHIFESNMKDINFIYSMISNFKDKHPDYILKIEDFYQMNIEQILKEIKDLKTDLIRVIRDFEQMIDSINKFNGDHSLILSKVNTKILPKFKSEVLEFLKTGSIEDKIKFLLEYIKNSDENNSVYVAEIIKLWNSPSRKEFESNIDDLRKKSIGFIKQCFNRIPTTENNLKNIEN